jgi:hypothetical protein
MIVITMARKPLSEPTVAANVTLYGTGALNIDGCRVGTNPGYSYHADRNGTTFHGEVGDRKFQSAEKRGSELIQSTKGRWPANFILEHLPVCIFLGTQATPGYSINRWSDGMKPFGGGAGHTYTQDTQANLSSEMWDCTPGCPVSDLDAQSGDRVAGGARKPIHGPAGQIFMHGGPCESYADQGTAARFFTQVNRKTYRSAPPPPEGT